MECIAIEKVIATEIADVRADPVSPGLTREKAPTNDAEVTAMQNLVLQTILEKRRALGGYVGWKNRASFERKTSLGIMELAEKIATFAAKYDQYLGGCCYEMPKDEARLVEPLEKAAKKWDWRAQMLLGLNYTTGGGVVQDYARAVELLRKAADGGFAMTFRRLQEAGYANGPEDEDEVSKEAGLRGIFKFSGATSWWLDWWLNQDSRSFEDKDEEDYEGFILVEYEVSRCFAWAEYELALCYLRGTEVPKDEADYRLGLCYLKSIGVAENKARAAELFAKAADQGYVLAQYRLGLCYLRGIGVAKDKARAAELFRKAAADNKYSLAELKLIGQALLKESTA
ncbi:hypothetical protein KFL_012750030 [Klebsormidium nitens]|uniref:Sel1 repeat family protein n=1 Tax=Klebsormidium nitens TaxID=105231 RepID=A0A1Y1IWE7_KLENI|nr:hypothetical protein KFL_012750030 [Klebsormidium nitens]|eukprot:GAQ93057.1 hypothetical protein KFL_012750030 [Klebsormidium nitens]